MRIVPRACWLAVALLVGCAAPRAESTSDAAATDASVDASSDGFADATPDSGSLRPRCEYVAPGGEPVSGPFLATEESLAAHSTPTWFRDAKFGIFVHWGPYSVPAFAEMDLVKAGIPAYAEWYWFFLTAIGFPSYKTYHEESFGRDVAYDDFMDRWSAAAFDAERWASLIKASGARYAVLVTKHHDGVALWDTATSQRNTVDLGPGRDFVCELAASLRAADLKLGLYYSLFEWFHPAWPGNPEGVHTLGPLKIPKTDPVNPYTGEAIPYRGYEPEIDDYVADHVMPQVAELVDTHHPDLLWFDGGWDRPREYWRSAEIVARYYNRAAAEGRDVAVNDRTGLPGDFRTAEYEVMEAIPERPWEATQGIGWSFGYNQFEDESYYKSSNELVDLLVDVVSKGGNLLLNIGPMADGTIPDIQQQRLLDLGAWLAINGEAIYGTRPWTRAAHENLRFTVGEAFYITALEWPGDELVAPADVLVGNAAAGQAGDETQIVMLGREDTPLAYRIEDDHLVVSMPPGGPDGQPSRFAWTLRLGRPAE
jgi:alpha-L-fucosidase